MSGPPGPGDSRLQNKPGGTEAPAGANRLGSALNSPDTTRPAGGSLVPCLPFHAPSLICPIDTWVCKLPQATATPAPHCPHLPFTRMPECPAQLHHRSRYTAPPSLLAGEKTEAQAQGRPPSTRVAEPGVRAGPPRHSSLLPPRCHLIPSLIPASAASPVPSRHPPCEGSSAGLSPAYTLPLSGRMQLVCVTLLGKPRVPITPGHHGPGGLEFQGQATRGPGTAEETSVGAYERSRHLCPQSRETGLGPPGAQGARENPGVRHSTPAHPPLQRRRGTGTRANGKARAMSQMEGNQVRRRQRRLDLSPSMCLLRASPQGTLHTAGVGVS